MKEIITFEGTSANNRINKEPAFKNNAPFRSCISKINNIFIDNAEDVDIVLPMCNLVEYSDNFSMTSGSLWNYCRDVVNDGTNEYNDDDCRLNIEKATTTF